MRMVLRDEFRRRIGRIDVDAALRPTRVSVTDLPDSPPREVFLNWDTALDDSGQLRRCVACGCTDVFKEKAFPQVTAIVVVLAFAGAIVGALGLANTPPVLIAMGVVLVLDVAILLFSQRRLVCYHCRTTYHGLPIARYHRSWDRATADRHPAPQQTIELAVPERHSSSLTANNGPAVPAPASNVPADQKSYFA
jgi:hypothetical protein